MRKSKEALSKEDITDILDLGYADYSEYFIWHSGSTYWRKKDSEKAELFR